MKNIVSNKLIVYFLKTWIVKFNITKQNIFHKRIFVELTERVYALEKW